MTTTLTFTPVTDYNLLDYCHNFGWYCSGNTNCYDGYHHDYYFYDFYVDHDYFDY